MIRDGEMKRDGASKFQILSLDGGGILGLYTALVLAGFEKDHGVRIQDCFDLIVGTSTGGILALGLGAGFSPQELVEFYLQEGPKIFRRYRGLRHIFLSKFRQRDLELAIKKRLGDIELGSSSNRLVIPSYDYDSENIYLFKTPHHVDYRRDHEVPMWKVALATSAAPTYFKICRYVNGTRMIDGGLWANNPSLIGISEAISKLDIPLNSVHVLSIGTTSAVKSQTKFHNCGGWIFWANSIAKVIMKAQSEGVSAYCKILLANRYLRINSIVPKGMFELDKLNLDDISSYAIKDSRQTTNEVHKMFLTHKATKYHNHIGGKQHDEKQ
ncbi:CBASS cGAMP-activated phospholipase [Candidatus Cloacimonadota bacterium]